MEFFKRTLKSQFFAKFDCAAKHGKASYSTYIEYMIYSSKMDDFIGLFEAGMYGDMGTDRHHILGFSQPFLKL